MSGAEGKGKAVTGTESPRISIVTAGRGRSSPQGYYRGDGVEPFILGDWEFPKIYRKRKGGIIHVGTDNGKGKEDGTPKRDYQGSPCRGDPGELKERFASLLRDVNPSEIAEMEEQLIKEGMPEEEVKRLCDVHVAVFKDALDQRVEPASMPGHPVHTFRLENDALRQVVAEMEALLSALEGEKEVEWGKLEWTLKRLQEVENHYLRKELQFFPYLEKHGITGPPKVMWATHDDIRALFKKVHNALTARDKDGVVAEGKLLVEAMSDMFYKEEKILFPMALETLSEREWAEIKEGN